MRNILVPSHSFRVDPSMYCFVMVSTLVFDVIYAIEADSDDGGGADDDDRV